jgi:DNA-binding winged helix-turn-helix (wHTH) protein
VPSEAGVRAQFDDLIFDSDRRQLWCRDEEVRLSPKAFELLGFLIAARPRALSKAEIHQHLWPASYVSDSSLPALISEIRDAIGDRQRQPPLLRTVHGFGYAFQAGSHVVPAPDGVAWLVGKTGELALHPGENIVGREGPGVILVASTTVSRRHVRIAIQDDGAVIEDLGSKNGTWLNGSPVATAMPLADGDRLRVGSVPFIFRRLRRAESTETQTSHDGTLRS